MRNKKVEIGTRRTITVGEKRQVTMPEAFCRTLGIDNQVDCILGKDCIIVRKSGDFGHIQDAIKELIKKGLTGEKLEKEISKLFEEGMF